MASRRDAPRSILANLRALFLDRLAARLSGLDRALRAELVCAHLVGVASMRRVLATPALRATGSADIATVVSPLIQQLIDDPHDSDALAVNEPARVS